MIKKLLNYIANLSIVYKLLITYIAILFMPILLFIFINGIISSKDNEQKAIYSAKQVLSQTNSFIEYNVTSAKDLIDFVSLNSTVQKLMYKSTDYYSNNIGMWNRDTNDLGDELYYYQKNSINPSIYIYMRYGLADFSESDILFSLRKNEAAQWYKQLSSSESMSLWFPGVYFNKGNGSKFISLVKKIPNVDNLKENIGMVRIDISQEMIQPILNKSSFMKASSALLINSKNEIISSSTGNKYTNTGEISEMLSKLPLNNIDDNYWSKVNLNNEDVLIGVQEIKKTDWKLILFIPYKTILETNVSSRRQLFVIFLLLIPLMLPVAFFVARSATKRISRLNRNMKKVGDGDIDIKLKPKNNDEIGQLINNYNDMLYKIKSLMDDKYLLGREVKNMELKALQAQINPHFLYNTLDLINWMSIRYKVPEIGQVVENLSRFYRLSLSKGDDVVSLKNELEHVIAYVKIQNMRLGNNIDLRIEIPEELLQYRILKITLQPIVENAIIHGIMEKDEEAGTIKITGTKTDNIITLNVEDDGVGMDEEQIANMHTGEISKHLGGYGLKNINQRLFLNYGSDFGLECQSVKGKGTTVTITIPAVKEKI